MNINKAEKTKIVNESIEAVAKILISTMDLLDIKNFIMADIINKPDGRTFKLKFERLKFLNENNERTAGNEKVKVNETNKSKLQQHSVSTCADTDTSTFSLEKDNTHPVSTNEKESEGKVCHNNKKYLCEGNDNIKYCEGCLDFYWQTDSL